MPAVLELLDSPACISNDTNGKSSLQSEIFDPHKSEIHQSQQADNCQSDQIKESLSPNIPAGFPVRITIQEGRFHQIKRMAHALGANVLYLKRESMGPLKLDPTLKPGEYRPLTEEELTTLQNVHQ
jgi:pseudouridine synthase